MTKTPIDLLKKEAQASLAKNNLHVDGKGGIKVRLVLDHSGSMIPWYRSGAVQRLTEQVLGLASALDDDGTIEAWYFGSDVSKMYEISLNQNSLTNEAAGRGFLGFRKRRLSGATIATEPVDPYYVGWVDRSHVREPWGMTNYEAALKAPVDFQKATKEEEPALVIIQTDGGPDSPERAAQMLRTVSGAKTFFAFVVFGEEEKFPSPYSPTEFMRSIDTLDGRVRDNASAFFVGNLENYATLPDSVLYDGVLGEFTNRWLQQIL